jgi:ArsR family transcriptional regulator
VDAVSRALKALSHPVRLRIMHILGGAGGSVCACDVEARFDLSQPTISHHLRLLREAGLVETEHRGPWVHYSPRKGAVAELARQVAGLVE